MRQELAAVAPRPVEWIDSGEAIARRVESFIGGGHGQTEGSDPTFECWLTLDDADTGDLRRGLTAFGAGDIRNLNQ